MNPLRPVMGSLNWVCDSALLGPFRSGSVIMPPRRLVVLVTVCIDW